MKFKGLEMGRWSRITQVDPREPRESLEVKEEGWRVRVGEDIRKEVVWWLATSQGMCGQPLEAGKHEEPDSPLEPPEKKATLPTPRLCSVRPVSDFWPPELQENKSVLFYTTKFVVISDSSSRKPIHCVYHFPPGMENVFWIQIFNQEISFWKMSHLPFGVHPHLLSCSVCFSPRSQGSPMYSPVKWDLDLSASQNYCKSQKKNFFLF